MPLFVKYRVDNQDGTKTARQSGPYDTLGEAEFEARDIATYVGVSDVAIDNKPIS